MDDLYHNKRVLILITSTILLVLLIPLSVYVITTTFSPYKSKPQLTLLKQINKNVQTGKFVIEDSTLPQEEKGSYEDLAVIDGIYDTTSNKITLKASKVTEFISENDKTSRHPQSLLSKDNPELIVLLIDVLIDNKVTFQTHTRLKSDKTQIPFRVRIPFSPNFTINIYNSTGKLLITEKVNL